VAQGAGSEFKPQYCKKKKKCWLGVAAINGLLWVEAIDVAKCLITHGIVSQDKEISSLKCQKG
jgi:hypothetical protein